MAAFYCTVCGEKMADRSHAVRCGRCRNARRRTGKREWKYCKQCGRKFTKIEHLEQGFACILWRKRKHTQEFSGLSQNPYDPYDSTLHGWNTILYCPTCPSWQPDILPEEIERARVLVAEFLAERAKEREKERKIRISRPRSLDELEKQLAEIYGIPPDGDREGFLRKLIATLTPREEQVIRMHYGVEEPALTLAEIGERFGVSRSRAEQIERKGLTKLLTPFSK